MGLFPRPEYKPVLNLGFSLKEGRKEKLGEWGRKWQERFVAVAARMRGSPTAEVEVGQPPGASPCELGMHREVGTDGMCCCEGERHHSE